MARRLDVKSCDQATTSAELVRGALAGESAAWEELVRRYDASLHRVARSFRLDRAAADDAVQTTWLRLVEHLDSLQEPERVGAWLMTTLRRHIGSMHRSRTRGPQLVEIGDVDLAAPDRSPEDVAAARDTEARVGAAMRRLPARSRRLLTLLTGPAEYSYSQVSSELGMPVGSIGPTRARCLDLLRHELQASGIYGLSA